ncbi:MAG: response regulator [Cyanobacteria bacterium REEB65]|nr:response regulator [Cyanobacteria bacterium REEB65]
MVVDDERANREIISRILHLAQFHITECRTGTDALALLEAQESRFDLVVLDLKLPGASGIEVLQTLRSRPATATLPVVCVSAMASQVHIDQAMAAGANRYLTKPFRRCDLVTAVQSLLVSVK